MKTAAIAVLLVSAVLVQTGSALYTPTTRDQNRQIILAEAHGTYNAFDLVDVTFGRPGNEVTTTVTAGQALEMQLDFLERHEVSLLDQRTLGTPTADPDWPLTGALILHEVGWRSAGAACPTIVHDPTVGPAYEEVRSLYRDLTGVEAPTDVGHFDTTISEAWVNAGGQTLTSWVTYYPSNPLDPVTYLYGAARDEGWTLRADFVILDVNTANPLDMDFFCVKGPLLIRLDTIVAPRVDRLDD